MSLRSEGGLAAKLRLALHDIIGGGAAGVLTMAHGLSFSLLIFAGPLSPYLSYGLATTFLSSAVIAAVVALGSSLPFAIAGPESATAALTAILASSLVEWMASAQATVALPAPVLITFGLASIATGIVLCGFGLAGMGGAIRYVPYPVVGGFLGATSCLILQGAIRVITGDRLQFATLGEFSRPLPLSELAAAGAMALLLHVAWHRAPGRFGLPLILISGVAVAHLAFWLAGISPQQAQLLGWSFQTPPHVEFMLPWHEIQIGDYPWQALPDLIGDLIAVVFVTATCTLLNTAGIEVASNREADIARELKVTGLANLLSALVGGYSGCISVNRSLLNLRSGGSGRISGLTVAAISALMLPAGPALLGYTPKFVLGGLLIYLGAGQLNRWIIQSRRRLTPTEHLSLLVIVGIIMQWGFVAGVGIGCLISCATFALSAAQIEAIQSHFDGSIGRPSSGRPSADRAVLAAHGGEIQGLHLQSHLFFGSANRLDRQVSALLARQPQCRFLLFDFRLVTGMDSSAAYRFAKIRQAADQRGITLIFVHLAPALENVLRSSEFMTSDVRVMHEWDDALAWCENEILASHRGNGPEDEVRACC